MRVRSDQAFSELLAEIMRNIDISIRFPKWPFLAPSGFITIYEYDIVLSGSFGTVLSSLSAVYGDQTISLVGLEPSPEYYRDSCGAFPGFRLLSKSIIEDYWNALKEEPNEDFFSALIYSLDIFGIIGSSGLWAVWAQRDWEIGLLLAPESSGPWLEQTPWFDRYIDLDLIRGPAGWCVPLNENQLLEFSQNIRERGSGQNNYDPATI